MTAFDGAGAGSAGRVRHLIRGRPGHHARPASVRTARCSLHWRSEREAGLRTSPVCIRRFQEALARAGLEGNFHQSAVERRKASGPVTRVAAVPGNGCSSRTVPGNGCSPRCAARRSASLVIGGSKMEMPRLRRTLVPLEQQPGCRCIARTMKLVIASGAKQSSVYASGPWIASSLTLLAMTRVSVAV